MVASQYSLTTAPRRGILMLYVLFFFFFSFVVVVVAISWAAPAAYGGSQARGLIRAVAASLHHSYSNAGSEPRLQPTYTTAQGNTRSLTH